jgi:adenylate kinase
MGVISGITRLREAARIILVGAPGVGKGTQSERLMRRYPQLATISTGDLLRDNVRDKTSLGRYVPSCCLSKHADLCQDCKRNRS